MFYLAGVLLVTVIVFLTFVIVRNRDEMQRKQLNSMSTEQLQAEYEQICKDIRACMTCKSVTTSAIVLSKIESDHTKYASRGIAIADILTARGVKVDYTKLYIKKWGNRTFY